MTAHVSAEQLERYLGRTLAPAEILVLHHHLDTCPDCREALADAASARGSSSASPLLSESVDPHLLEAEMVAFVADRMPQARRAKASAHLKACEDCRDSVAAMESVRSSQAIGGRGYRRPMPAWIATAGSAAAILLISTLIYFRSSELRRPTAPSIVASLRDAGQTVALSADGTLQGLTGASPEERKLVGLALARHALPAGPQLAAGTRETLRAPGAAPRPEFSLIGPVDAEVLSDRPVFTWQAGRGITAYEVVVTNESLDPLVRSGKIVETHWQPATALPRGVTLLWQVRASRGAETVIVPAPPDPPAEFRIVPSDVAARIEQLRASDRPSHLLIAVLCARAGLRDEAQREIAALARENPASPLVRSLQAAQK